MKAVKILLCAAVSISVLGAAGVKADARMATVYRENVKAVSETTTTVNEDTVKLPEFNLLSAEVMKNEDNRLLVKNTVEDEEVLININEDTLIIDGVSKLPVNAANISEGTKLLSYNSQAKTFSIPPITNSKAVIVNADENSISPIFFTVNSVVENSDGTVTVTDTDNTYMVTLNKDTAMNPYLTRNIVTINDVKIGDKLFVWKQINENGIMTLELPQKITAQNCILKSIQE